MPPTSIISALPPCKATYTYVVGLGENGLHWFKYLNTWSAACGIVWKGLEGLGVTLLGEVFHWGGP